jgi:hypothetical protein
MAVKKRATRKGYTSRRKSDGKPRKLRKATNQRSQRRQARKIVEARRGKKLSGKKLIHHRDGNTANNSPRNLQVVAGRRPHEKIHPGK